LPRRHPLPADGADAHDRRRALAEPPYKPKRDVRLIPDPDAGLPQEIQDEIRAAVVNLFAHGHPKPVISDPGDELMLRMMRACLGENVTPEYAPLMREKWALWRATPAGPRRHRTRRWRNSMS